METMEIQSSSLLLVANDLTSHVMLLCALYLPAIFCYPVQNKVLESN